MKEMIGRALKPLSDWMFDVVLGVPLPVVRYIFLGLLAAQVLWVLTLPSQRAVDESGNERSLFTDLRLIAVGLLVLQSILYIIF